MGFLPEGTEIPKENSKYMKPIEGTVKFRVVGPAIVGYEYWTDQKKPVRLKNNPTEKPKDVRMNDDGSWTCKYFWAFPVIDRNDLGGVIKIMEITQKGILKDLEAYLKNEDWGDITGYDISIIGTGKNMDREYRTVASPHKPLTPEEKKTIESNPVNLEALFVGGDPFSTEEKPAEMTEEEECSADKVPF